jgi:DNA-binding transcriptional LysR family regulator
MDLRLLRSFVAVATEEHVGRAAKLLFISQPALSKQIRRLEGELGVPLVRRVGRRIELTAAGKVLAVEATRILEFTDAAIGRVRASMRAEQGEVVIAFVPPMPHQLTTDVLREACGTLDCVVTLHTVDWHDQVSVVASGRADLSLVRGPVEGFTHREHIRYEKVFEEPRVAAFSTDHPLAVRTSLALADLADEPIVVSAPNTDYWTIDPRPDGSHPVLGPVVSTVAEMLEVVAAGQAMVLTAKSLGEYYRRADISYVDVQDVPPSEVFLAWSPSTISRTAAMVRDDVQRRARELTIA